MTTSPRYAPAREDGTKPYVVTVADWGKTSERLVYAKGLGAARYRATLNVTGVYAKSVRRASPEDVTNLKEYR
jgi:hypothetical protein